MKKRLVIFIFAIIIFPFLKADIVSVNSGGDKGLAVNSDNYIEGFFGCVPMSCAKLGFNCGSWNDRCGKMLDCGSCASGYSCSSGVCAAAAPSGGGGAGGGGGGIGAQIPGITITPSSINLTLSYNNQTNMSQRTTQKIFITNNGKNATTLPVSQSGLDSIVILPKNSISINPGEMQEFDVDFIAPLAEKDFSGKIILDGYEIPVFIHVTMNPLWFDSNIIVLNKDYQVSRGGTLMTSVELIPQGEKSRLDVTLNYAIKDYSGKIYLTKSETVLVSDKTIFKRDFGTGMLPVGQYIISLEVGYPGGIASSSAHFEVLKMGFSNIIGTALFFLISAILIVSIFIVIMLIKKRREKINSVFEKK